MERSILLWLGNDQDTYELCTGVAMDAATLLAQDDVHAPDHDVHLAAGRAIADQLIDWVERIGERAGHGSSGDGPAATMLGLLKDLLDAGDSQLWGSIGESFLSDWTRPAVCSASDCEQLATDDDGHCDDCRNLDDDEPQGGMADDAIRIGQRVTCANGPWEAEGLVESGHAEEWFVRTDEGELTGPWAADQMNLSGS